MAKISERKVVPFPMWKDRVNEELLEHCGMPSDSLPDIDYWALYEEGYSPQQAAKDAIENLFKS